MKNERIEELIKEVDYLCDNSKNYSVKKIKSEVKRIEEKYNCFLDYIRFGRTLLSMRVYELEFKK